LTLIQASVAVDRSHPEQDSRHGIGHLHSHGNIPLFSDASAHYTDELSTPLLSHGHRGFAVGVVVGVGIAFLFICTVAVYVWSPDGEFDKHKAICYSYSSGAQRAQPRDVAVATPRPVQKAVSSPEPLSPPCPKVLASTIANTEQMAEASESVRGQKEEEKDEEDVSIDSDARRLRNRVEEHMRALSPPRSRKTSGTVLSPSPPTQVCSETLPPICPSLILSDCEARCAIAVKTLANMEGKPVHLDVIGLSGNQLFRADVQPVRKGEASLMLNVSLAHSGSIPRVTVLPPTRMGGMQINGPGGSLYGWLKQGEGGFYELVKDDALRLVISGNMEALDLEMRASTNRQIRATASRSLEYMGGEEHLEFRVQPGFDMVLIVSCVLAVLLIAEPYPDE